MYWWFILKIKIDDLVTRKSYNNDTVFKVINIKDELYYLKGKDVRLFADAYKNDLVVVTNEYKEDKIVSDKQLQMDRNDFFYLPGKILHIDGDSEYLERCLSFYKDAGLFAIGKKVKEEELPSKITSFLLKYKPDIVVITGHDAYYKKKGDISNIDNYKNTKNFIMSVNEARKFEKSHEKLIIIAGACQSNYEELIKAGANFASSPKRVNIHALDPAIIATTVSLTERSKEIDLFELLDKTKYGKDGMGGLICNGIMYVGYPR